MRPRIPDFVTAGGVWRVIFDGPRPPAMNMALDAAIVDRVASGACPPTLRFYGWDRPAISLGYHQVAERVLDMRAIRKFGMAVVVRPTGGRAVLHGDDLTYSVALSAHGPVATGVTEVYRLLSEALQRGFQRAGLDVALARGHRGELGPGALPCFASTARYELVWQGRKLVGSAQRRLKGGLLQQGSIPMRRGSVQLEDLLPEVHHLSITDRWTTIEEAAGRQVDPGTLARGLAEGFEEWLGITLCAQAPDPRELDEARRTEARQ